MAAPADRIVDLGIGQPDYPTPDHLKQAGCQAIADNFTCYTPQPGFEDLRRAVAAKFQSENGITVPAEQVVVSCGAKHSLYNIFQCALREGDEVIILSPYWMAYPEQVKLAGGTPVVVPTDPQRQFQPNIDALAAAITPRTVALVINSPCNPTGAVFEKHLLGQIAELACRHNLLVISDEVYEHFVYDGGGHVSIASLGKDIAARTATVNSISKTHSMTGWRIGYAALPLELAQKVTLLQSLSTSGPNAIGQRAALAALTGSQAHVGAMATDYQKRRDFLAEHLCRLPGLSSHRPAGAFYFFADVSGLLGRDLDGRRMRSASDVTDVLLKSARIKVLDGTAFGSNRHIRLSFAASMADLADSAVRLERLLK
jgi:aspartate aminotransferase